MTREIPALEQPRDTDNEWHHDTNGHWKDYDNGTRYNAGNHTPGAYIVDRPAAVGQPGTEHANCTTCGYTLTREIPALEQPTEQMAPTIKAYDPTTQSVTAGSQLSASIYVRTHVDDYAAKLRAVGDQYNNINTDPALGYSMEFANKIKELNNMISEGIESNRRLQYQRTSGVSAGESQAKGEGPTTGSYYDRVADAIVELFGADTAGATTFENKLTAYRRAAYITNREKTGNGIVTAAEKTAEFNTFCQNNGITVTGTVADTMAALLADLRATMPRAAGAARFNLLQQLEDFENLMAFSDDVQSMGFLPVTREWMTGTKLHENVISADPTHLVSAPEQTMNETNPATTEIDPNERRRAI